MGEEQGQDRRKGARRRDGQGGRICPCATDKPSFHRGILYGRNCERRPSCTCHAKRGCSAKAWRVVSTGRDPDPRGFRSAPHGDDLTVIAALCCSPSKRSILPLCPLEVPALLPHPIRTSMYLMLSLQCSPHQYLHVHHVNWGDAFLAPSVHSCCRLGEAV